MRLSQGTRLGGRYVLDRRAWDSTFGPAWLARDDVLERTVLVQLMPGLNADAVSRAVARAVQVTHPGLCQIYDVCSDPLAIVFESAPGGRLADRRDTPLPPPQAAATVCQLASAISALHERGAAHGAIGPETVLFDEEGRPKLVGAGLADDAGADGRTPDGYRPREHTDAESRDRYALAAVAYRLFTGREPGPGAPPARSARRSVPPEVDALLSRALAHDAAHRPTLEEFQRALGPIAATEPPERGPGFFRQEARWLFPALLVVGLAIGAVLLGLGSGALHIGGGKASPRPSASVQAYPRPAVFDFDPDGNGEEHPDQARLAVDGTEKGWTTVGYKTANLGGGKPGVGLLFDLGDARAVGRIEVRTSLPGWRAEWRVADARGAKAADYRVVDSSLGASFIADGKTLVFTPAARGRWWLLWITRLVDNGSGSNVPFQAQVSEVTFFPR
jgi:hypothetical protein